MKQLLSVLIAAVVLVSIGCSKASKKSLATQMNAEELKAKYGIVISDFEYNGDEIATAAGGNGKSKQKASAVTLSIFNDLTISESGGVITTSISPDAEWGGVQKWVTVDTTNNATSLCNWNWSGVQAPASKTCDGAVPGFSYRSWTSDKVTYDVHVSVFLPL